MIHYKHMSKLVHQNYNIVESRKVGLCCNYRYKGTQGRMQDGTAPELLGYTLTSEPADT